MLAQSFWVGILGVLLAVPAVLGLAKLAEWAGVKAVLPAWLVGGTAAVTLAMAMISGMMALRSLRMVEPANLLR